uniref:Uncharacterized protein n=1 Tax=Candidatus Kentrum sp. LFY TaxID=2126342 RepID=A0A450UGH8_9GAMM|nr:MAG: hypothetical protein BECKLFY1418A_GA0070994_101724 [Candidatus Kentron sp. LFY]
MHKISPSGASRVLQTKRRASFSEHSFRKSVESSIHTLRFPNDFISYPSLAIRVRDLMVEDLNLIEEILILII